MILRSELQAERSGDPYPRAPWRLHGWGFQTLQLVDLRAAKSFAPAGARLVPVLPGKTLGGIYFAAYEAGSSLRYHELIVAAGLVSIGGRLRVLTPRLYVDSTASLAGGREIWSVPKELAEFAVEGNATERVVSVRQDGREICRLRARRTSKSLPGIFPLPAFGLRSSDVLFFTGRLAANVALARIRVDMPAQSEFATLGLGKPMLGFSFEHLRLIVPAPHAVLRPRFALHPQSAAAPVFDGALASPAFSTSSD